MRFGVLGAALLATGVGGCSYSGAVDISGFSALDRSLLSAAQVRRLAMAEEDFRLVDADERPRHAIMKWALRDGGTIGYEGDGYVLIRNRRMGTRNGVQGQETGATITLSRQITGQGTKTISTKRFVAKQSGGTGDSGR